MLLQLLVYGVKVGCFTLVNEMMQQLIDLFTFFHGGNQNK